MSFSPRRHTSCAHCKHKDNCKVFRSCKVYRKYAEEQAKRLTLCGYRRISNRYRIVARVDRLDWTAYDADYYRRCTSKDQLTLPQEIYDRIPASQHDQTGFVKLERCDACKELWPADRVCYVPADDKIARAKCGRCACATGY